MRTPRLAAAALLTTACLVAAGIPALAAAPAPTADLSEPQRSSGGVEVRTHGSVTVRPYQDAERDPVVMAVHAVQRVEGATVVYYSVGAAAGDLDNGGLNELAAEQIGAAYISGDNIGSVRLVDPVNRTAYAVVLEPDSAGTASPSPFMSDSSALPEGQPGVMGAMYAVLPELPVGVSTVDVDLLYGVTVADVPVADGYLTPTADPESVIPLGTAWPAVDQAQVAQIAAPEKFTYPLSTVVEALDDSEVVTDRGETVSVDVAADVLFAFDKSDLSAKARAKLATVAKRLVAEGATGTVTVVGHTDDESSDAYNLALSKRRAQSVASVLGPALSSLDVKLSVTGKGESEPLADNDTDEGRQANRRVTITYTAGGER